MCVCLTSTCLASLRFVSPRLVSQRVRESESTCNGLWLCSCTGFPMPGKTRIIRDEAIQEHYDKRCAARRARDFVRAQFKMDQQLQRDRRALIRDGLRDAIAATEAGLPVPSHCDYHCWRKDIMRMREKKAREDWEAGKRQWVYTLAQPGARKTTPSPS